MTLQPPSYRGRAAFDAHHPALAAHPDAFGERDFGRQGQVKSMAEPAWMAEST